MQKKKVVVLFGAGAVLDWGAPKTICKGEKLTFIPEHGSDKIDNRVCCLTHLITAIGFKDANGERITNKIFEAFNSKKRRNVNFETIINILEDLYNYWSIKKDVNSRTLSAIADLGTIIDDFHFFEYSKTNPLTNKYSISIPDFDLLKDDYVSDEIHPNQKYYELFLDEVLGGIIGHISKYSYYTPGYNVIFTEHNKDINEHFYKWMAKFISEDYSLRMYTLNYDRIFKVLLQDKGIDIFEGFDITGSEIKPGDIIPPNIPKILTDTTSNVYYNLHGSAYWTIKNENINNLPGYQYFLSGIPESNDSAATMEVENGRKLLLTNIITGYQKVQKTAISPFRQILSAFDRDCFESNKLYIIGYSFGDEHINDIIRNARKYNKDLEIILINPDFDDKQFMIDFILHWDSIRGMIYKNEKDEIISPDYKVRVIQKGFAEYLRMQNATVGVQV
jgi:hypothetical protein